MNEEVTYTYTRSSKGDVETSTTGYGTAAGAVSQSSKWDAESKTHVPFPKGQHGKSPYFSHSATCSNGATLDQDAARKLYADIAANMQTHYADTRDRLYAAQGAASPQKALSFHFSFTESDASATYSPPALIKAACDKAKTQAR